MDNLHISLKAGTQEEYDTAKAKNDPLQASEFLLQENVKKQKETFTVSAKEKSARIQVLQEEQKKETDEGETAKKQQEIDTVVEQMKENLLALVGDYYSVAITETEGDTPVTKEMVYYKDEKNESHLIGTKEEFEQTFIPGILKELDVELQQYKISTDQILAGIKLDAEELKKQIVENREGTRWGRMMHSLGLGAAAGGGMFAGRSFSNLLGAIAGDEKAQQEVSGPFAFLGKFRDGITTALDNLKAGTGSSLKATGAKLLRPVDTFAQAMGRTALTSVTTPLVQSRGGAEVKKGGGESLIATNEICTDSPDRKSIYKAYCEPYAELDASLVGNSAAMRNNNPGNIKLPSRSGTTKKVLDELNINYEEGSRATDGGYFCKFANVGDGLAAMLAVFSSNRNNTLEYFFGKYSNNSYEQEQMLPTGATKDTYLKQLTDVQLIELLQRMRKREDGDMYALIQEHGESSLVG